MEDKKRNDFIAKKIMAITLAGFMLLSSGCAHNKPRSKKAETNNSSIEENIEDKNIVLESNNKKITQQSGYQLSDIDEYIKEFKKTVLKYDPSTNFEYFDKKVNTMDILDIAMRINNYSTVAAMYDVDGNDLFIGKKGNLEESIYHEFFHILCDSYDEGSTKNTEFLDGNQGIFLCEGINSQMCNDMFGINVSYQINQQYVKILSYALGSDFIYKAYTSGDIEDIIKKINHLSTGFNTGEYIVNSLDNIHSLYYYDEELTEDKESLLKETNRLAYGLYYDQACAKISGMNENEIYNTILEMCEVNNLALTSISYEGKQLTDYSVYYYINERIQEYASIACREHGIDENDILEFYNEKIADGRIKDIAQNKSYMGFDNIYNQKEAEYFNDMQSKKR